MLTISKRHAVVCRASVNDKPIFQHPQRLGHISIPDARDAYDTIQYMNEAYKEAHYTAIGIDGEMVEKYLEIVENMEVCFNLPPANKKNQRRHRFKKWKKW